MGILSWLFGQFTKSSQQGGRFEDDDWDDDDDDDAFSYEYQNHGRGKYTSRNGNGYERFRPDNDIENRSKYKIVQTFEVAGAFARKPQIEAICEWLARAPKDVKVTILTERESTNKYDPNAIKLLLTASGLQPTQIGYLPKEIASQYTVQLPVVELETIYQRREITARTLVKRDKASK
jgi:hypothetical protein